MYCTYCSEAISGLAEICPKCGVRQYKVKNYCYSCQEPVNEMQEICTSCGVNIKNVKPVRSSDGSEPMHPAVPAILSFFLSGVGQIVNGQVAKGIVCLVGEIILAIFTLGFSVIVTTPLIIVDAYLIGKKRVEGKQVGEWEFF